MRFFWTYENCYELAKKCTSRSDFYHHNTSAYQTAIRKGWLDDYTWFKASSHKHRWTKELCRIEASKYCSRSKFRIFCSGAFGLALRKGWLDEFYPKNNKSYEKEKLAKTLGNC